jgi:hypothetical protein
MDGYTITHMSWNGSRNHYHPDAVTYRKPDGSEETNRADGLPFAVNG